MVGLKRRITGQQTDHTRPGPLGNSNPTESPVLEHPPVSPTPSPSTSLPRTKGPLAVCGDRDEHNVDTLEEESIPGFLGSTNFFSSLGESHLALNQAGAMPIPDGETSFTVTGLRDVPKSIAASDIEAGASVLASLFPLDDTDELVDRACDHHYGPYTPETILRACWTSLRSMLYPFESHPNRADVLKQLSRRIFHNTVPALPNPCSRSMKDYTSDFTGGKLRWESVGMIVSGIGAQLLSMTNSFATRKHLAGRDLKELARWLADASNRCISFCDDLNLTNDLKLWMTVDNLILTSQLYGDSSKSATSCHECVVTDHPKGFVTWKRLGDLWSGIVALGLHAPAPLDRKYIPRWLVQVRKQIKRKAYHVDLNLSMFMGRPPRFTSRYCTFGDPPLELLNEELALEPAELEEVIKTKLNAQGERYNRIKTIRPARYREAFPMLLQREQILELCLSSSRDDATYARAQSLLQQSKQLWESREMDLQHDPKVWAGKRPAAESYVLLDAWLDHRYNEFLLQRVLVQRFNANPEELLVAADELLSNTLFLLGKDNDADIDWTVSLFSLPSAGVLALELLKQQTQPDYRAPARAPPRSRMIQNLSVLIAALKWISREGVGNYSLGRQATATLERVLERVLNADNIPARVVQTVRQQELSAASNETQHSAGQKAAIATRGNVDSRQVSTQQHGVSLATPASSNDFPADERGVLEDLPWHGQFDFDEAFWQGLEEHPMLDAPVLGFSGAFDT